MGPSAEIDSEDGCRWRALAEECILTLGSAHPPGSRLPCSQRLHSEVCTAATAGAGSGHLGRSQNCCSGSQCRFLFPPGPQADRHPQARTDEDGCGLEHLAHLLDPRDRLGMQPLIDAEKAGLVGNPFACNSHCPWFMPQVERCLCDGRVQFINADLPCFERCARLCFEAFVLRETDRC